MIKKNDVLKGKHTGFKKKVLGIIDGLYCLSMQNADITVGGWYTPQELERDYVILESKWEPKEGERYFYITSMGNIDTLTWRDDDSDHNLRDFLGIYPDRNSVEQALAEIKRKIKE